MAATAEKLHLDPKVIEALEADRFAELGASVYVRGHLRRYADFVGEPGLEMVNAYSEREARPPPPDLTQVPHPERRTDPRRLVAPLVGLGCALVLALRHLVGFGWLAWCCRIECCRDSKRSVASDYRSRNAPPSTATPPAAQLAGSSANAPPPATTPVTAEPPPPRQPVTPTRPTNLRLVLSSESWVEVYDARGERLFYDVASAGSVQSIEGRPPLRVVLGNAAAVSVQVDGQTREIPADAADGEGARFVVNRSGSLSRARQ